MKIAVLGSGNGGIAIAGYLAIKNFKVNIYSPFCKEIAPLRRNKVINLQGKINGSGRLNLATDNLEQAIEGAELIMVVAPAFAHRAIAAGCAPYLKDNQIIVLNPGRTGGALEFNQVLREMNLKADVIIAETQTLIYACRKITANKAMIHGIKNRVSLAALPAIRTSEVINKIRAGYPQFVAAKNVLETSLDNVGAVFHPAIMWAHRNRIARKQDFYFYQISKQTARILEEIDKERLEIAAGFGIKLKSAEQWLTETYNVKGRNLYQKLINNPAYASIKAPTRINVRQVLEDVPYGLVPIVLFGKLANLPRTNSALTVNNWKIALKKDFWKQGRNLKKLGLANMNIREIKEFANRKGGIK